MSTATAPRSDANLLLRDGIAAAQSGNKVRARLIIRQSVAAEPANEVAWLWLANLAAEPAEAVESLRKVLALDPAHEQAKKALTAVLVKAGAAATEAKDPAEARRLFAEAAAVSPNSEAAWAGLAGSAERPEDALVYLTRVLELNPDNKKAKQGLDHLHTVLGHWTCPLCDGVGLGEPDRCPACRAVVNLRRPASFDGPTGADEAAMTRAVGRLAPHAVKAPGGPAAFHLGLAYLNLNRPAEAIKVFNAASLHADADPKWKNAVRGLAEHWRKGDQMPAESGITILPPKLILLVDDSPTVRKLVTVALQPAGFRVVTVSCAEKVQAAVDEYGGPDLFLIDIGLPGEDGFSLAKRVRKDPETAPAPVVFLTGRTGTMDRLRGKLAGGAAYVTKPFQQKTLVDTVTAVLHARAAR